MRTIGVFDKLMQAVRAYDAVVRHLIGPEAPTSLPSGKSTAS